MFNDIFVILIELHSFCNRKCIWCPNKTINRSFYKEMPEETFINFLKSIKDSDHRPDICFNRFNEPMYNMDLLKRRSEQVLSFLPNTLIRLNTNGDFMTKENLDGLNINKLIVNDYDNKGVDYCIQKLESCGVTITKILEEKSMIKGTHKNINTIKYRVNWPENFPLQDRGGYFQETEEITFDKKPLKWRNNRERRTFPCKLIQHTCAIDYTGEVTPCSHLRADNPEHNLFRMGNINQNTIKEIFESEKYTEFRQLMASDDYTKYPKVCQHCQNSIFTDI